MFYFKKNYKKNNSIVSKPKFKVVLIDKEIKKYIKKARENIHDIDKLYKEIVFDPIWKNFASKGSYSSLVSPLIKMPIKEIDLLEKEIDLLINENVVQIVENALKKCNENLSGIDTTVYILPAYPSNDFIKNYMNGVYAFTIGKGKILFQINPLSLKWKGDVPYTVAHEYHHSIWTINNFKWYGFNLLELIVFEGKADSFANILYPNFKANWNFALTNDEEQIIWNKIRTNLKNRNPNFHNKVLYGYYDEFPLWSGYTIGYNIVQEFLKNNINISIEQWTNLSAKEILSKSNYENKLFQ